MKKIVKIVLVVTFLFELFSFKVAFASSEFPDVSAFHPNYLAINYLKTENVISGFSDGTFGSENNITRCEFLKILIRASKIETEEVADKPFPDIETGFWCNQYASKAKDLGVVSGDEFGYFWPQRNISRIEALKILYLTRQVSLSAAGNETAGFLDVPSDVWYQPYVRQAVASKIISEYEKGVFGINKSLRRSEMAELIYRSLALEANNQTVYNPELKPPIGFVGLSGEGAKDIITESPLLTFESSLSPIKSNIAKKYFDNIVLDYELPRTFVWHEVYQVRGKLDNSVASKVTIFLNRKTDGRQATFIGEVDKNGYFEIAINFKLHGTFNLGIVPGLSGVSNVTEVVVLPEKDSLDKIDVVADNLRVWTNDSGNAVFSWDNQEKALSKIVIKQGAKQVVKIISGGYNQYIPDYTEFKSFNEGKVYFAVFLADSSGRSAYLRKSSWGEASSTNDFEAVAHNYFVYEKEKLALGSVPFSADLGTRLKIVGSSKEDLRPEIALIEPSGSVKEISLSTSQEIKKDTELNLNIIPAPADFSVTVPLLSRGVYFIEINYKNGLAGFNSPVYVGGVIPLIPDFRDLDNEIPAVTRSEVESGLDFLRQKLLLLINKDRQKYGLATISLSDNLDLFAQTHSDDMANNNYFSHLDQDSQGPGIRKKMFGIETPVGENLAKAKNLTAIHQGLMRSAIHRANILRDDWTEVGLGISMDKEGYLLVVQEFSTTPITQNDLGEIRDDFYSYIQEKRINFDLESLFINKLGEEIATTWSRKMVEGNFFDFQVPGGSDSLQKRVQASGFENSFSTLILSGGDLITLKQGLDKSQKIYGNPDWTQVSVGLDLFPNGSEIRATVIFFANQ